MQPLLYLMTTLTLTLVAISLPFIIFNSKGDSEKLSAYECGFEPFSTSHTMMDIHFYLVGIIYLIFDVEIVFLFPWAFNLPANKGLFEMLVFSSFLVLVIFGLYYEWTKNVLSWSVNSKTNL